MSLLHVSHWKQRRQADCLVACTAMILAYLQIPVNYEHLMRLLRTMPVGTFFRNLRHLESALGLSVSVGYGNTQILRSYLDTGLPVIASVNTQLLTYWNYQETIHAVVVTGIEQDRVYLHDPAFDDAPQELALIEFEAAWFEQKELYAVIALV
ncbi:MAG: C39 family peptidase [Caldilineaceae bacterium]|nr:C39 family peptidase [Caldilineaceae bacterium]